MDGNLQLKNQTFTLARNGRTIAELAFDGQGRPALGPAFDPAAVRLFLAVMTLIIGEYPKVADLILDVRTDPSSKPRELP